MLEMLAVRCHSAFMAVPVNIRPWIIGVYTVVALGLLVYFVYLYLRGAIFNRVLLNNNQGIEDSSCVYLGVGGISGCMDDLPPSFIDLEEGNEEEEEDVFAGQVEENTSDLPPSFIDLEEDSTGVYRRRFLLKGF